MPVTFKIKNVMNKRNMVVLNNDADISNNAAQKNWIPLTLSK